MLDGIPSLAVVAPVIVNSQVEQITATRRMDPSYKIPNPLSPAVSVYLKISADSGHTWEGPTVSL